MKEFIALVALTFSLTLASPLCAAPEAARALPAPACGAGWGLDGKPAVYDRETLSDHIDGEAELFIPYGFESMAYARYAQGTNGFDLEVYRMGSLLDAFAMFAGYRPDGAVALAAGGEGAVTSSQLFFYQGRYFVRLQSTGAVDAGEAALSACARAVSVGLPAGGERPKEPALLDVPEVVKVSVRYSATSLLGYDFLPRGMMADALVGGDTVRLFVVLAPSPAAAGKAADAYRAYLRESGARLDALKSGEGTYLTAVDPLYGKVLFRASGRYLIGMARVKDPVAAVAVLEKVRLTTLSQ